MLSYASVRFHMCLSISQSVCPTALVTPEHQIRDSPLLVASGGHHWKLVQTYSLEDPPPPPVVTYDWQAGGTHPTGMFSCYSCIYAYPNKVINTFNFTRFLDGKIQNFSERSNLTSFHVSFSVLDEDVPYQILLASPLLSIKYLSCPSSNRSVSI